MSRKPTEDPETVAMTSYGSLDTWDSSVAHSWKDGYPMPGAMVIGGIRFEF